jgi:L-2-hydroxycarboxylate dehydrogenase (NAD+)
MSTAFVRVSPTSLQQTVRTIFEQYGETQEGASAAADALVGADLRGIEIEGVSLLASALEDYRQGLVKPRANWRVVRESSATATIDGDRGLVWIIGAQLMTIAIEKASKVGVGIVSMYNGGDAGRLGHYAEMAAKQDMVGLVASAQGLRSAPLQGAEPRLGANPLAIAAPTSTEVPFVFDGATTVTALGTLRIAHRDGRQFPPGTIAELDGTPVMVETPPRPVGQYYLLPLGGDRPHGGQKGYGLSLMVEVLATMLSGALPTMVDPDARSRCFFAALNIAAFTEVDAFKANMDLVLQTLRTTKPAPGQERVRYPGESSHEEAARRKADGIPLHPDVIKWFNDQSRELSIPSLATV